MKKEINKVANLTSGLIGSGLAVYSELCQMLVKDGKISYEPFMGYLSDFGAPVALTSWFLYREPESERRAFILGALPFSVNEFIGPLIFPEAFTFDPKDILCYWAGASLALGVHKLTKPKSGLEKEVLIQERK